MLSTLVFSNLISIYYFRFRVNEKKLKAITEDKIIDFDTMPNYITSGTNSAKVMDDIDNFINDLEKNILILSGNRGVGKTRLLEQYFQNKQNNIELFKGSFDEQQTNYNSELDVILYTCATYNAPEHKAAVMAIQYPQSEC